LIELRLFLSVAAALFSLGLYGVLTRRNAIGVLLSVELMANAVNLNLAAFGTTVPGAEGAAFTLFAIALTVTEVVVGLALVVLLYRSKGNVLINLASDLNS